MTTTKTTADAIRELEKMLLDSYDLAIDIRGNLQYGSDERMNMAYLINVLEHAVELVQK